jgi:hypothetical protein
MGTQHERRARPRIAKVRDPRSELLALVPEPFPESQGPIEKVRQILAKTADLDGPFDLMRRKRCVTEDEEGAAAERVEKRAREAIDVDRRTLSRRKAIKRCVD